MQIYLSAYLLIPKHTPLSLCNITWIHVFRADCLVLDINWCTLSWRRLPPPALRIPWLPVVLYVAPLVHTNLSMVSVIWLMFRQSCWWDFMSVAPDIIRTHKLTSNSPILWLFLSFCLLSSHSIPWTTGVQMLYRCVHWDWSLQPHILIGWGFLL